MTGAARAGWPDFGRTTMNNNGRRRESVRAGLAGQPPSAQVAGRRTAATTGSRVDRIVIIISPAVVRR